MCIVVYKLVDMSDVEAIYGVIYKITCFVNGKIYIGQTTRSVEERFQEHMKADTHIGRAIRKHGVKNFKIEVIAVCATKEELDAQEIRFIAEYDCMAPKGYNCTAGGHNGSLSEETKARLSAAVLAYNAAHPEIHEIISEANIRRFSDPVEREKQAERTRKVFENPEIAAKHAESQRRRFERQEERDKISEAVTERFSDPAEREAQSERIKAYFDTPGARERNGASQKKRFEDPAERKKVSDGVNKYYAEHGGRQQSQETREKISVKRKAYWRRVRIAKLLPTIAVENLSAANLPAKVSDDLKKFYAANPDAVTKSYELRKKSHAARIEKRNKQSDAQKARRARERIAKMPLLVANQNRAAANLPAKIALS